MTIYFQTQNVFLTINLSAVLYFIVSARTKRTVREKRHFKD